MGGKNSEERRGREFKRVVRVKRGRNEGRKIRIGVVCLGKEIRREISDGEMKGMKKGEGEKGTRN